MSRLNLPFEFIKILILPRPSWVRVTLHDWGSGCYLSQKTTQHSFVPLEATSVLWSMGIAGNILTV